MRIKELLTVNNVADTLVKRAKVSRKISRSDGLEILLRNILKDIDKFNSIPEDESTFEFSDGKVIKIEDIPIMNELGFLIIPESVRVDPLDLKTLDVGMIPIYSNLKSVSYTIKDGDKNIDKIVDVTESSSLNEYKDRICSLRRYFKKSGYEELTQLSELRKSVSLFNIINKICIDKDKVHYFENDVWPYFVSSNVGSLFNDTYFNASLEEVTSDYLFKFNFV